MHAYLACPICKALSPDRALCPHCAEQLFARREPVFREEDGYSISSLFTWERDGWRGLRWWAAGLKHQERPEFWRQPALWALETFAWPKGNAVLVPVPGSSDKPNHARGFARTLSAWAGWPVEDCLSASPQAGHQKRLGRQARRLRKFQLIRPFGPGAVIIVDDIVTTGATARAAHLALGQPKGAQVWCLMDRRPCGA